MPRYYCRWSPKYALSDIHPPGPCTIRAIFNILLFVLPVVIFGIPTLLLLAAVQTTALVTPASAMNQSDAMSIQNLLRRHDPRKMQDGEQRTLTLTTRDLNVATNYALRNSELIRSTVSLQANLATAQFTYALPKNPIGQFFNMSVSFAQSGSGLKVDHIAFGDLEFPGRLINPLTDLVHTLLQKRYPEYAGISAAVQKLTVEADEVQIVYQWKSSLMDQLSARGRDLLLPQKDRRRVEAYYVEIAARSKHFRRRTPLTDLLQPLFSLAEIRTQSGEDAASEHRALFLALGVALSGSSVGTLLGDGFADSQQKPAPMLLTLADRGDLALHFAFSAAISAAGGGGLADAVGIFKELSDSRGGSGFSFVDLLADRAGVKFAEYAMGAQAHVLQQKMASSPREADYMPIIEQLPEGLLELEFKSRYQDLSSRDYALVDDEIERRINACNLYQM